MHHRLRRPICTPTSALKMCRMALRDCNSKQYLTVKTGNLTVANELCNGVRLSSSCSARYIDYKPHEN
jgi:hypothetical protein